jgi:hypothetical protein
VLAEHPSTCWRPRPPTSKQASDLTPTSRLGRYRLPLKPVMAVISPHRRLTAECGQRGPRVNQRLGDKLVTAGPAGDCNTALKPTDTSSCSAQTSENA